MKVTQEFFWTDSQVVLEYIGNEIKRFHVFVANRVQQIHAGSSLDQWLYVDTKSNPADEGSRGLRPSQLTKSNWINGPNSLWQEIAEWKVKTREVPALLENGPEVKGVVFSATVINSSFRLYWKDCSFPLTENVLRRLWHCVCGTCVALELRLKLKLDTIYVEIRSVQGK